MYEDDIFQMDDMSASGIVDLPFKRIVITRPVQEYVNKCATLQRKYALKIISLIITEEMEDVFWNLYLCPRHYRDRDEDAILCNILQFCSQQLQIRWLTEYNGAANSIVAHYLPLVLQSEHLTRKYAQQILLRDLELPTNTSSDMLIHLQKFVLLLMEKDAAFPLMTLHMLFPIDTAPAIIEQYLVNNVNIAFSCHVPYLIQLFNRNRLFLKQFLEAAMLQLSQRKQSMFQVLFVACSQVKYTDEYMIVLEWLEQFGEECLLLALACKPCHLNDIDQVLNCTINNNAPEEYKIVLLFRYLESCSISAISRIVKAVEQVWMAVEPNKNTFIRTHFLQSMMYNCTHTRHIILAWIEKHKLVELVEQATTIIPIPEALYNAHILCEAKLLSDTSVARLMNEMRNNLVANDLDMLSVTLFALYCYSHLACKLQIQDQLPAVYNEWNFSLLSTALCPFSKKEELSLILPMISSSASAMLQSPSITLWDKLLESSCSRIVYQIHQCLPLELCDHLLAIFDKQSATVQLKSNAALLLHQFMSRDDAIQFNSIRLNKMRSFVPGIQNTMYCDIVVNFCKQ